MFRWFLRQVKALWDWLDRPANPITPVFYFHFTGFSMSIPALGNYTPTVPTGLPAGGVASFTYTVTPTGGTAQPAVTVSPAAPVGFPVDSTVTIVCHFIDAGGVHYIDSAPVSIAVPNGQTPGFTFTLNSFTPAVA